MPQLDLSYILESPTRYRSESHFLEDLSAIRDAGFRALELQMESPANFRPDEFARLLNGEGLRLVGFQTGSAYRESGLCLASPDPGLRRRTADLLKRYVDLASSFGVVIVFGLLQGTRLDESNRAAALDRIRNHLADIADHAASSNVTLVVEPVNRYECDVFHNTVDEVISTLAEIAKPSLAAMVDTFHANIEERSQREAIHAGGSAIRHIHLSETNRGLFGTGHLNLQEVFGALSDIAYQGACSVGVYPHTPSLVERVQHSFRTVIEAWKAFRSGLTLANCVDGTVDKRTPPAIVFGQTI